MSSTSLRHAPEIGLLACALFPLAGSAQEVDKACEMDIADRWQLTSTCITHAMDVALDDSGQIWIADGERVLRFPQTGTDRPLAEESEANLVLGKPDFVTSSSDPHSPETCAAEDISRCWVSPRVLEFDQFSSLWIAEDDRVLRFSPPFTNGMPADFSLPVQRGGIQDLTFDSSGNLWVASSRCDKVVRYSRPISGDSRPDLVIGQPDVEFCVDPKPVPERFGATRSLALNENGDRLFVSDNSNNRILIFEAPFSDFMSATAAMGQNDLFSSEPLRVSRVGLTAITGLSFDSAGNLWVIHNFFFVSAYSPPFEMGSRSIQPAFSI